MKSIKELTKAEKKELSKALILANTAVTNKYLGFPRRKRSKIYSLKIKETRMLVFKQHGVIYPTN